MTLTARRVLPLVMLGFLASIEARAFSTVVKVGPETEHIDLTFTFECSPDPISVRFVGRRTISMTQYYDDQGVLERTRQHAVAKFDHYDPETGEKLSHDNWTISVAADYAGNTTTVTGAFWKLNAVGAGGPVIRDIGRIVFDQAIDDLFTLDFLWSTGAVNVIDSSGPHEYFDMTIPFPQMYCMGDGGN